MRSLALKSRLLQESAVSPLNKLWITCNSVSNRERTTEQRIAIMAEHVVLGQPIHRAPKSIERNRAGVMDIGRIAKVIKAIDSGNPIT